MRYRDVARDGFDLSKWTAHEMQARRRSRGTRWFLLLGVGLALLAPVTALLDEPDKSDRMVSIIFFMPLLIANTRSPFARDTWVTTRGAEVHDEFERDVLAQASRRAYAWLLALVFAGVTALWIGAQAGWPLPTTPYQWSAVGLTLLFVGAALPVIFAEWMVPIPPEGDEGDG